MAGVTPPDAPPFDALQHGLWSRFKNVDGPINEAVWLRACAEHGFVGTCRMCGSYLVPLHPEQAGKRKDFEAHCSRWPAIVQTIDGVRTQTGCGWVLNAPNGRTLKRSSRWSEQPDRRT